MNKHENHTLRKLLRGKLEGNSALHVKECSKSHAMRRSSNVRWKFYVFPFSFPFSSLAFAATFTGKYFRKMIENPKIHFPLASQKEGCTQSLRESRKFLFMIVKMTFDFYLISFGFQRKKFSPKP